MTGPSSIFGEILAQMLAQLPDAHGAVLADWEKTALAVANWWGLHGVFAGLFAVPVGFIVIIGVSLFTRAPSDDVQRFVKGLRAGAA